MAREFESLYTEFMREVKDMEVAELTGSAAKLHDLVYYSSGAESLQAIMKLDPRMQEVFLLGLAASAHRAEAMMEQFNERMPAYADTPNWPKGEKTPVKNLEDAHHFLRAMNKIRRTFD